ncbi:MAG TPA: hypothetical protein VMR28_03215 [Candidatus Saccharimonadales bacterium]|nr:hypothetical protein [Candidatus Saccharimonadales bacterium]
MNTQFNGMEAQAIPYSPSLLKSCLQKSVRRGEVDKALAITKSLLTKDPRACLRRLMVIVLEDGLLLPNYDQLAILTDRIRVKGASLTEEDKSLILSMVADLTCCEWRDFEKENPDYSKDYKIAKLEDQELALVNAISYRANIGGYKGDTDMLRLFSRVWNRRFAEGSWSIDKLKSYFSGEIIEWADTPFATNLDIPLVGLDFHSTPVNKILIKKPNVVEMIQKAMPPETRSWAGEWNSDLDILNKVCWVMRSGINTKRVLWTGKPVNWLQADNIPEQHWQDFKDIYKKIEPELDNICQWYLDKVSQA